MARKFMYNGMELADPDTGMTAEQVRDVHSVSYPDLATATVSGPRKSGEDQIFTFQKKVGAKG